MPPSLAAQKTVPKRLSQLQVYKTLQAKGTHWLKRHVLYADRQLVVLNKPSGLVCQLNHKSGESERHTQAQNLVPYFRVTPDMRDWLASDPHHVHRLDKGTTGCLLLAVNRTAATSLSQQFQQGTIRKRYLALVQGGKETLPGTEGRIDNCLVYRDGRGSVSTDGKAAFTKWKLLASSSMAPVSLLQLDLLTGHKHQLRLHLSQGLNTPILGDDLYTSPEFLAMLGATMKVPPRRMFLHASEISLLKYSSNGQRYRLHLRSPLPSDFHRICRDIGVAIPDSLDQASLSISETRTPLPPELQQLKLWQDAGTSPLIQLQVQSRE